MRAILGQTSAGAADIHELTVDEIEFVSGGGTPTAAQVGQGLSALGLGLAVVGLTVAIVATGPVGVMVGIGVGMAGVEVGALGLGASLASK